jgi:hypothetical protein
MHDYKLGLGMKLHHPIKDTVVAIAINVLAVGSSQLFNRLQPFGLLQDIVNSFTTCGWYYPDKCKYPK